LEAAARGGILAAIVGIDSETFYRLHYRQICGQLQLLAAAESRRSREGYRPLTSFLLASAARGPLRWGLGEAGLKYRARSADFSSASDDDRETRESIELDIVMR